MKASVALHLRLLAPEGERPFSIPNWFAGSICHLLGVNDATARSVLTSWGPGKFDAELFLDGKVVRPDGKSGATFIPPAFGFAGVNLPTWAGVGSVTYGTPSSRVAPGSLMLLPGDIIRRTDSRHAPAARDLWQVARVTRGSVSGRRALGRATIRLRRTMRGPQGLAIAWRARCAPLRGALGESRARAYRETD